MDSWVQKLFFLHRSKSRLLKMDVMIVVAVIHWRCLQFKTWIWITFWDLNIGHFNCVYVCIYVSHQKSACSYRRFTNTHIFVLPKSFFFFWYHQARRMKLIIYKLFSFHTNDYYYVWIWSRVKQVFCCNYCCW